jgi:predicted helicase
MALSLKESNAVAGMAEILAEFLPYSGAYEDRGQVTYRTILSKMGIGNYWEKMSKRQGIARVLEKILEDKPSLFERFILEAVRQGLSYRQKDNRPIKREEIEKLNGLILDVNFRFPDLWDQEFLKSLEIGIIERAKKNIDDVLRAERLKASEQNTRNKALENLKIIFYQLHTQENRQAAGFAFEKILNDLFKLFGLQPRSPFKLIGEQIDGSFCLDNEIYLVEAKWHRKPISKGDLVEFHGKVDDKSQFTRGLFISLSGISEEAKGTFTRGRRANFFVLDGYDISLILEGQIPLDKLLRTKLRKLAEEGVFYITAKDLMANSSA